MPEILHLSGPEAEIGARLKALERRIDDLSNRNPFTGTNLSMSLDGHLSVNGLPLHPTQPAVVMGWQQNFAVTTSTVTVCSTTITVPAGYTQAILFVNGQVEFYNQTAGLVTCQGGLGAIPSTGSTTGNAPQMSIPVAAGQVNQMTGTLANVVSDMSPTAGQTIAINGYVLSTVALAASTYNAFAISGVAIFLA